MTNKPVRRFVTPIPAHLRPISSMLLRDFLDPSIADPFSDSIFKRMGLDMGKLEALIKQNQNELEVREIQESDISLWVKGRYPKVNIYKIMQDGVLQALKVVAAVPGYAEDDVSVELLGGELSIKVGVKENAKEEKEQDNSKTTAPLLLEIPQRYSETTVGIAAGVLDLEKAAATFPRDGTVVIEIPRKEELKVEAPRQLLGKT